MRVLIDTNIFIYREDPRVLPNNLTRLIKLLLENGHQIIVHPASIRDINNDRDAERKQIMLSKIRAYPVLENPPIPDQNFFDLLDNPRLNEHSKIDIQMLYAIFRNAVHYFITEDKEIHKFATKLGIEDKVLDISTALVSFSIFNAKLPGHFRVKLESMHNIDYELPFFDSLREDYGDHEFNRWFVEKSRDGRRCWVHYIGETLCAILILKDEDEEISLIGLPPLRKKRRLKITTLKVECKGLRIGELLLKMALRYGVENHYDEVYLTHFIRDNDGLVKLIQDYGFILAGERNFKNKKGENERIFVKKTYPDHPEGMDPTEMSKRYYPCFVDSARVKKFIIPIIPKYHDRLFQDYKQRQTSFNDYLYDNPQGNTIKKAYLSSFRIRKIKPGDILLFYRTHDEQKITSIGIVDNVYYDLTDVDEIWQLVERDRSVYSYDEVKNYKKPLIVVMFRHHFNLPEPISREDLIANGVIKYAPQSINEISQDKYNYIKRTGELDGRFTFD